MTADEDELGYVEQRAEASGRARVYQAGRDQHFHLPAARSPLPQALVALPPAPGHLVGREVKVGELLAALAPGSPGAGATVVVSAVAGLAGIGKTALALHTAHEAAERGLFPGGVLFVTLRGYDPAGAVSVERALGILLRQLGIRDEDLPGEVEGLAGLYQSELARRVAEAGAVLVVADDASSTTQLVHLVPAQPVHRLLVTSRNTLTSPTFHARLLRLDELDADAGAELIRDAVALAWSDDQRLAAQPEALAKVVALCGRLPLALRIAAALLTSDPGLSVTTLAEDLADTLNALQFVDDDGQSLAVRAAFDLSRRRLAPEAARVFRLLGLCAGPGLATDSAAALTDRPLRETRSTLVSIARAGLLNEEPVGSGRWRMHDLIRLYTTELASPHTEESQQALDRLLDHYTSLADAANNHLGALPGDPTPSHFDDRAQALGWLDAEHPTLTATITAIAGHRPRTALTLAFCLQEFLFLRRHFDDALTTTGHALTITRGLGDRRGEGTALNNLGNALHRVRRFQDAIDAHSQDLAICRDLGDHHREGQALNNLGNALREVRRFAEAIDAHSQDLAICRDLADRHGEGAALNNLGLALQEVRRFDDAIDAYTQARDIYRDLGEHHREGTALNNLGTVLQEVRRFDDAIDAHTQAADIFRDLGERHGVGQALNNLGLALQEVRRFDDAIDAHTQAADIFRDFGDRHSEGTALNNLGLALREVRRFNEAIDAHTQARDIHRDLGEHHGEGQALNNLGNALREVSRFGEAIDAHTRAADIFRDLGDQHGEGQALNNLGNALQEVRRFQEAIDAHTRAADIFRDLGDQHGEGQALNNLGLALREVSRFGEAIDALTQARNIFRDLGDHHGEELVQQNLASVVAAARRAGGWWGRVRGRRQRSRISQVGGDQNGPAPAAPPSPGALVTIRQDATATQDSQVDRVAGDQHTNEPTP